MGDDFTGRRRDWKRDERAICFLSGRAGLRCLNLFSGLYGTTEVVPFPRIVLYGSVASHPLSQRTRKKGGAPRFEVDAGFLDFARDDRSWEMIHRAAEG